MKKILLAWIEQVLQFDDSAEYNDYMKKLQSGRPQKFKVIDKKQDADGKVFLIIRKQYNNNQFPEDVKGGENDE